MSQTNEWCVLTNESYTIMYHCGEYAVVGSCLVCHEHGHHVLIQTSINIMIGGKVRLSFRNCSKGVKRCFFLMGQGGGYDLKNNTIITSLKKEQEKSRGQVPP